MVVRSALQFRQQAPLACPVTDDANKSKRSDSRYLRSSTHRFRAIVHGSLHDRIWKYQQATCQFEVEATRSELQRTSRKERAFDEKSPKKCF
jgi:hypothetical protein